MTRLNLLILTLCALIGDSITYWMSYPVVAWLSTLKDHELVLVVIVVVCVGLLISALYDDYKLTEHNRRSTDQKIDVGEFDEMYFSTQERLDKDDK